MGRSPSFACWLKTSSILEAFGAPHWRSGGLEAASRVVGWPKGASVSEASMPSVECLEGDVKMHELIQHGHLHLTPR